MPEGGTPRERRARLPWIDALRGAALAAMVVYHFSWDLRFFGFIEADVAGAPGWRAFARLIAGSFLFLVGVSLVLAAAGGLDPRRWLRRLLTIAAAAGGVTLATWLAFPETYVFFGILHSIALSSVLAVPFLRMPVAVVAAAAALVLAAPAFVSSPVFDHPALLWVGLGTYFPRTNDYVPVFPWFGVVLLGIAAARLAALWGRGGAIDAALPAPPRVLAAAGRHSLAVYLVHQPVLFGAVAAAAALAPPSVDLPRWHAALCESQCAEAGGSDCRAVCACLGEGAAEADLLAPLHANALDAAQTRRYLDIAEACRAP